MGKDEKVMNRFQKTGKEYQESLNGQEEKDVNDSKDSKDDGGIKDRRESFQAYIPAEHKERIQATWRKIQALCSLSEVEEPTKNDFYTAVLVHGYRDLEGITGYLDLEEEYRQRREVLE